MNIIKWLVTAVFSFGLILGIACQKQKTSWKGTIETKDGAIIVKNPKLPIHNTPVLELKEVLVIKGSEEIEEQMFQNINTLDVDEEGHFYILDEQSANIKVFDASNGDLIVTYTIPQEKPATVLQKFSPEFESILTFASIPMDTPPVINIFVARSLTSLRWTVTYNDEIIWADIKNPEYELRFHDTDGKLKRIITRDYDPISITTDDKDRLMEQTFGDNPTDQWDVRFPDNYPPFSGFSFDDLGYLFVKRYEKEADEVGNLYDIFDSEGRYIAQMRFKMNPMIWKKGHMYTIEEDEEGFKVVKRYKVNWKI